MMCIDLISMNGINILDIPEDIYKFCPYSNICNRTASKTFEKNSGKTLCCSSCSCHEDCGLQHNCCFDHLDRYKLVESGRIACLSSMLRNRINTTTNIDFSDYSDYYMVQQCDKENAESPDTPHVECNLTDEYGNSLIAPVSSLDTNMIYINRNCAACNKVDMNKLQDWNYLFISENVATFRDLSIEIETYAEKRYGMILYIPPEGQAWSHKRCYNNLIETDSCENNENWLKTCRMLRLPFQEKPITVFEFTMYRNIYCRLCLKQTIEKIDYVCHMNQNRGEHFASSFSILIDSTMIKLSKMINRQSLQNMQILDRACPTEKKKSEKVILMLFISMIDLHLVYRLLRETLRSFKINIYSGCEF